MPRDTLLDRLWPESRASLGSQSLNSLIYSLHKSLGDCIDGVAPVLHHGGSYRLNVEAGVGVDVACFDDAAEAGERKARAGQQNAAAALFQRAIGWYKGELSGDDDVQSLIERERLRARYLNLLSRLADYSFDSHDYGASLSHALLILSRDPCREDAHRLVMQCHVRQGERFQAIRQYCLCEQILRVELEAAPEPATRALFDRVRLDPGSV